MADSLTASVPGFGRLSNRVLGLLRSFGRREQEFRLRPQGQYISDYSLFAAYGQQDMGDSLRLEYDLQSRYMDYEDMDDYVETCVSGDSMVFTLEWGWKEIRWLAERKEPFHVLSYDAARKSLVPARADGAAMTGSQGHEKPMVRVTLDSGQSIRCTADHLFMTRGGEWVAAAGLTPGQRLMPGDLRLRSLNSAENQTYWQVCQPGHDAALKGPRNIRWSWVHRLVGETMLGMKKNEVVHHHEEGGPWNNAPGNLAALSRSAHTKHHLGPIDNSRFFPEWTEERKLWASKRMLGNTYHKGVKATKETRQKMSAARRGRSLSPEHRQRIGDAHRIPLDPSKIAEAFRTGGTVVNAAKLLGVSWSTARRAVERVGLVGAGNNHRVVSVEPIPGGEPVYDLTVPIFHNFVCNGVVVHNSGALDLYADESTQPDPETGKSLWVEADVGDIKDKLDHLFTKRLKIEEEVWEIARTLCKYGNDFEELLVNDDGVVGLSHLPAPSVRRIEKDKGFLMGFIQSITGMAFTTTAEQFEKLIGDKVARESSTDALFEDWQVAHFRFRSKLRRSKYGYSASPNSRVWCNPTVEEIKDIPHGKPVFLHKDGEQIRRQTRGGFVTGRGMVYRFQTRHREIEFTKEHHVLARKNLGSRSHPRYGPEGWFRIEELVPGDQVKICTMMPAAGEIPKLAELAEEFYAPKSGPHGQVHHLSLADRVTPAFCRFLGFMLGDGWIHGNQVCFARSKYTDRNIRYDDTLKAFGMRPAVTLDGTQTVAGSIALIGVLRKLGWIDGAHEKRVPKWVFGLPEDYRREFLAGFMDADGWEAKQDKGPHRVFHIELCNRELLRDLKNLVDGLGLRCGNIRERAARTVKRKDGGEIRSSKTYTITFREGDVLPRPFAWDTVIGMEPLGEMDVYDVSIASDDEREHNFIADGVVVHNSVLEPARWIWKRLVLLEDAALIYRLTRSPSRYVFTVDVGSVPRNEIPAYLEKMKNQLKKKKIIDPKTGKLSMRFNPLCLSGDTEVALMDGRTATIRDLAREHEAGKKNWVYSVDEKTKRVVPGEVLWAGPTRQNAEMVEVVLDNGKSVRCTPDHGFLMRDGVYVEAQHLGAGDSLMPLYRKPWHRGKDTYEMVFHPGDRSWDTAHRIMGRNLWGDSVKENGTVVHHQDFNGRNNYPENLAHLTISEHKALHYRLGAALSVHSRSDEKRRLVSEQNRLRDSGQYIRAYNHSPKHAADNEIRAEGKKLMWADPQRKAAARIAMTIKFDDWCVSFIADLVRKAPRLPIEKAASFLSDCDGFMGHLREINSRPIKSRLNRHQLQTCLGRVGFAGWEAFKTSAIKSGAPTVHAPMVENHRVVEVRRLAEREDTYTLTISPVHNFALGAGIVVANSYDEDFFLPSIGGTDLAKVDTLNGPTFPVMEDIEYFLKKLHTSLKIPPAYMGFEEEGTKATLTMQDVRWARTIMRVQRELRNGLKRIGNTHLVALGIDPAAVDWEIVMVTPSQIFELAQLEVRNARVEFADRMEKWVSNYWIMRNVFGYSDEEIFAIQKQREKEAASGGAIEPDEKPRKRREGEEPSKSLIPAGGPGRIEPGWMFGANQPPRRRMQPITEEWLFKGGKRDHEKWVEDNFRNVMRTQKGMASRLSETRELMMEIKAALASRRFGR